MSEQEYTKYLIESVAYSFEDDMESSEHEEYSVNKNKVYDAYETLKLIGPEYDPNIMDSVNVRICNANTEKMFGKEMGRCYVASRYFFYKLGNKGSNYYTMIDEVNNCYWKIPVKVFDRIKYEYIASVSYVQTFTGNEYLVIDSIDETLHENYLNRIVYDFHTKTFDYHYYYNTFMTNEAPVQRGLTKLKDYRLTYIEDIVPAIRKIFQAFKIKIM